MTFQHQDNNVLFAPGLEWRFGKPCLERPAAVFRRAAWGGEPDDLAERLHWRIVRLLNWIDAAATGTLVEDGDPLELPSFPAPDQSAMLGFRESEDERDWWMEIPEPWGFATILGLGLGAIFALVAALISAIELNSAKVLQTSIAQHFIRTILRRWCVS